MRALFLHQNFPGQFLHVVAALRAQSNHTLIAVSPETNQRPPLIPRRTYRFETPASTGVAANLAHCAARGMAVADTLIRLKSEGFVPDLVLGHPGWGETLFVRDVWPDCRLLVHAEYFYSSAGSEAGFDPEFAGQRTDHFPMLVRTRNWAMTVALLDADLGIAPTEWQASRFPPALRGKITIAHEGVDTDLVRPSPSAEIRLGEDGPTLRPGDEVVTFVCRNLEPHRGYHMFMRSLPEILARRPSARAVIVGGEDTSYGPPPRAGGSWKQVFLDEVCDQLDLSRVHFVGRIPYRLLVELFQVSAAHVYLTYPFVLSWSMLDAMSAGTLVIGSRTPPVEEVIEHRRNGILCDFFDIRGIADAVVDALANPGGYRAIRQEGRATIERRFDLRRVCLPRWLNLIGAPDPKH
jgi:glycosyltransferase involved in cell wall biosynthesis